LWTGWLTQLYEYNMPFVELENDDTVPITQFTMTIGDTDYQFSNEFENKSWTNSYPYPADGSHALAGFSTPDIEFTSSITDGGDVLVIDFGDGGLQPGETVRFQVDINRDSPDSGDRYANYTSVFFNNDDQTAGDTPNSELMVVFAPVDGMATPNGFLTLPDFDTTVDPQDPRPYSVMQPIDLFPNTPFDRIPEPTAAALLAMVAAPLAGRRRA